MRGAESQLRAGCLALALLGAACVSPVVETSGGYRHRRHDYTIAAPVGSGPWEQIEVEGASLAFQRPGPDNLSLVSRCGKPVAAPQLMARHLTMGLNDRNVVAAGPIEVNGRSGWTQTFETERGGTRVRVKTVTLVAGGCTFDWILASVDDFESAELAFDGWWQSFQLGPRYAEEGG